MVLHKIWRTITIGWINLVIFEIVHCLVTIKTCWFNLVTFCIIMILASSKNRVDQSGEVWNCHNNNLFGQSGDILSYNYSAKWLDHSGDVWLCIISGENIKQFVQSGDAKHYKYCSLPSHFPINYIEDVFPIIIGWYLELLLNWRKKNQTYN